MTIAQTVRQLRTQLGHSQAVAAEMAGVSRRTWAEVELGQRRGSDDTLNRIGEVLRLKPGALAAIEVVPKDSELARVRRKLIDTINAMTLEQLHEVDVDIAERRVAEATAELAAIKRRVARDDHERRPA